MRGKVSSAGEVQVRIAKGWRPNKYLTNMGMAFFAQPGDWVAAKVFPICPVSTSTAYYYRFSKADLARDNVRRKPTFGKVDPAIMSHDSDTYACKVDQIIVGVDQIAATDYQRSQTPGYIDPKRAKIRFTGEQMMLHQDIVFAETYFKPGVWEHEFSGVISTPGTNQFYKFTDGNFDPVHFFDDRIKEVKLRGRRKPNKLVLGYDSYNALKKHPDILERIKYTGSSANPARVNENVLAQLFGLDEVLVTESTYNAAEAGLDEDMQFICDSTGALLCYTTNAPSIEEPSAGYIFTWDMLGNGSWMLTDEFEGEEGTHSEFIEGLMATDMKKTCDDLAIYFKECV